MHKILLLLFIYLFFTPATVKAYDVEFDFYDILDEHGSIMLILEAQTGEIEFANLAAQQFYGYSKERLESMNITQINTLTLEEIEIERNAAVREERNFFIFEHRTAGGEIKTVEVFSYPFIAGDRTLLFSIIRDITPAVRLAQAKATLNEMYITILVVLASFLALLIVLMFINTKRLIGEQKLLSESERKNETIVANIQGMVYRCKYDEHWTMEYVSSGCLQLTGYEPHELIDNAVVDFNSLIAEEFRDTLRKIWQHADEHKTIFESEFTITTKNGMQKWVLERGQVVYAPDGKIIALEGIITDITDLKTKERQAKEYYEKLHATLVCVGDGVITTDKEGKIELINPVAQILTGWSQKDAIGEDFDKVFDIINEYTRSKTDSSVKKVFETQATVELDNHTLLISRDGKETPIEDTAAPVWELDGKLIGSVVIFRDSSEKYKKKREIEYISYHDYLTGLFNRRFFEVEFKRLDYKRNYPISIILLDVNGLKIFNDAFGHAVGDELIKKVADVLRFECRQDDIIARYGGDEFALLLPQTNEVDVEKLANRIKKSIENEKLLDLEISVSLGWETKYDEDQNLVDAINKAENYMYQKKILENLSKRSFIIKSILATLLAKNPREEAHSQRVSEFCEKLGEAYKLSPDAVKKLKVLGELHDIGKIAINENILNKPEKLTDEEWAEIKKHPEIGYRILATSSEFADIASAIFSHHERWDGNGYPKGLKAHEIPFESRVIAIADAYDAMTSDRPYRKKLSEEDAIEEVKRNAGTQFDPDMAKIFLEKIIGNK